MNTSTTTRSRNFRLTSLIGAVTTLCLVLTGMTIQSAQAADTGSITGKVFTQAVGGTKVAVTSGYIYLYAKGSDGYYHSVDSNPSTPLTDSFHFTGNTFSLNGLKAGSYKFEMAGVESVDGKTYQREFYNNAESERSAVAVTVGTAAVPVADMVLEPAGQITGKVTDRAGNPLANASVSFEDSASGGGGGATTDANGNFTSQRNPADGFGVGLVRGSYRVSARLDNYLNPDGKSYEQRYWQDSATYAAATPVTVTPGATTGSINIKLDVAPRMRLTVKDPAGNPLPNTPVGIYVFYNGAWGPYQAGPNDTDATGVYRRTLRIGDRYKFFITPPTGVGGVKEWYDNAYTEATAKEIKATAYGQVIDFEIKLGAAPAVTGATPTISGTPQVGQTLTAAPGTWGPTGVALTYQWLAAGAPIAGAKAKTYSPVAADVGKALTVKVTGTLANHTSTSKTSAATAAVTLPTVTITGATPTISGTPRTGRTLTVKPGTWGPSGVALSQQWFASNVAIPGATGTTFKVTNAQAGKQITVRVTGKRNDAVAVTKASSPTAKATGVLTPKKVSISGTRKVGKKLRADTSLWGAKPIKLSYKWYRNGKTISGQTGRYYKLRKADKGKRISVRVYQRKTSYLTASKLSSKTGKIKK